MVTMVCGLACATASMSALLTPRQFKGAVAPFALGSGIDKPTATTTTSGAAAAILLGFVRDQAGLVSHAQREAVAGESGQIVGHYGDSLACCQIDGP